MAENVHITHIADTLTNIRSQMDAYQMGYDTTNNYLAIADATPTYIYEVMPNCKVAKSDGATTYLSATYLNLTLTGSAYVADNIYHYGDTDTYIAFATNQIDLYAGGGDIFRVTSTVAYVNASLGVGVADPDTRLEVYYAGTQLKLSYDGTDNATFAVDTNGKLTITPSGLGAIVSSAGATYLDTPGSQTLYIKNSATYDACIGFETDSKYWMLGSTAESGSNRFKIIGKVGESSNTFLDFYYSDGALIALTALTSISLNSDTVYVGGDIMHIGNTGTKISFGTNTIDLAASTDITFNTPLMKFDASVDFVRATADASDNGYLAFNGGGAGSTSRGGSIILYGNEHSTQPGAVCLVPGDGGYGIRFQNTDKNGVSYSAAASGKYRYLYVDENGYVVVGDADVANNA